MRRKLHITSLVVSVFGAAPGALVAQDVSPAGPKEATAATQAVNAAALAKLPFQDKADFEDARRGFVAALTERIRLADGRVVWDPERYAFLDGDAPATVHPSLWRQAALNAIHGLFKVTDGVYQVRGYDLANISFVETENGWIVVDPLTAKETLRAAVDLLLRRVKKKPVVAVVFTQSVGDHFAAAKSLVTDDDLQSGRIKIIAPAGFVEQAVRENIMAGGAMNRRGRYTYGNLLALGPRGLVDAGLGKGNSSRTPGLTAPTVAIRATGERVTVDGLELVFQTIGGAETPAEMRLYVPEYKALYMSEGAVHSMQDLDAIQGAPPRDALLWSRSLDESIDLFGDKTKVLFAAHHWPTWGRERSLDFLKKQRDVYKYIHDQTVRLTNRGYTMSEIAEMIELPPSLALAWCNRGYYGSLGANAKAVYQRYFGWFDGNPANLQPLPPVEAGKKYVEFMGGADALLAKAHEAYERGEYRWVAQVVNHLVFADPTNAAARALQADALEQLGYQSESGPWRDAYLTGALELRGGAVPETATTLGSPEAFRGVGLDLLFESLGVMLDGPKAAGKRLAINLEFPDTKDKYALRLENSVLSSTKRRLDPQPDLTLVLNRATLDQLLLGVAKLDQKVAKGEVKAEGRKEALDELLGLLDRFEFWFNIVTP